MPPDAAPDTKINAYLLIEGRGRIISLARFHN